MVHDWFPGIVYGLCFLTSACCAWLLVRSFLASRAPLLFWSGLCFVLLALNNLIVIVDLLVVPDRDLSLLRLLASALGVGVLLLGFIFREDEA